MFVEKIFNNNIVLSKDEKNQEVIVMGRGIAFQKRPGDLIDPQIVEKVFAQINKDMTSQLVALLSEIPVYYFQLTEEIIQFAKQKLGRKINDNVIIGLTDHIFFAIKRFNEGIVVQNGLLWEIKRLYKEEYQVGKSALVFINEKVNVQLPEDEAAFIALHLVNAQLDEEIPTIMTMTKVMKGVLEIVRMHFMVAFDEDSLNYYRFISHLKFFSQRVVSGNFYQDEQDQDMFNFVKEKYAESYECTEKISHFIESQFGYQLTSEERLYITVHIERLIKSSNK